MDPSAVPALLRPELAPLDSSRIKICRVTVTLAVPVVLSQLASHLPCRGNSSQLPQGRILCSSLFEAQNGRKVVPNGDKAMPVAGGGSADPLQTEEGNSTLKHVDRLGVEEAPFYDKVPVVGAKNEVRKWGMSRPSGNQGAGPKPKWQGGGATARRPRQLRSVGGQDPNVLGPIIGRGWVLVVS